MKYLKIGQYDLYAVAIILFATGLRVFLAALGWPPTNSDEGTMGIMARHIAYNGEHPILFYGQNYMGSIEAYLGAFFFHLFGPSLFALRLGVILLVMLFFIAMYLLTRVLYSEKVALVTLALLSVGSIPVFTRQIIATGGSSQTLLFGSLSFLLVTWLSLTYSRYSSLRIKLLRLPVYLSLGVVIGLGVWSDMVVLPTFAMACLLLLVFCLPELLLRAWPFLLVGFVIGGLPILEYNIQASTSQGFNSLVILTKLFHGTVSKAPTTLQGVLHGLTGTVLISIPTATGNPFCPVMELRFLGDNSPRTPACTLEHASWGIGYLALLAIALFSTVAALWKLWVQGQFNRTVVDQRQALVRRSAQLALLASAVVAIVAFVLSEAPTDWPAFHARYLITLLIVAPAIIAPLYNKASVPRARQTWFQGVVVAASRGILVLIAVLLVLGTLILFSEVPATRAKNQQQIALINKLSSMGITHIYTDYWTCDSIAFISNEKIICGAVETNLTRFHDNRVASYYETVSADPRSSYLFLVNDDHLPALREKLRKSRLKYRLVVFNDYLIYQPE